MLFSAEGLRGYLIEEAPFSSAEADSLLLMLGNDSVLTVTVNTFTDGTVRIVRRADDEYVVQNTAMEG